MPSPRRATQGGSIESTRLVDRLIGYADDAGPEPIAARGLGARAILGLLVIGFGIGCRHHAAIPDGDITAALTVPSLGAKLEPESLHGKPSLVLFVSPTCTHCLAELPRAQDVARQADANIVAVFVVGKAANATGMVASTHFTGPALVDDGTLRKRYAITSVPYVLVLGPDGRARDAFLGEQDDTTLATAIADAR